MNAALTETQGGGKERRRGVLRKRNVRQMRYLSNTARMEEQGPPRLLLASLFAVLGVVATVIVWAAIATVPITVSAPGEIRPSAAVHLVQHLEGGVIAQILVRDGDSVEEGQVLLRLGETTRGAELEEMRARRVGLAGRAERLNALVEDRVPNFDSIGSSHPELLTGELTIFLQARQTANDQLSVFDAALSLNRAEIDRLDQQIKSLAAETEVLTQERTLRQALLDKRLISRFEFLETERQFQRISGQLEQSVAQREQAKLAVVETEKRKTETRSRVREAWLADLGNVNAELFQLDEALAKFHDRVQRLDVVAPIAGVVNGLKVQNVGAVVAPGGELLGIVPSAHEVKVIARIPPSDIGHIEPGQSVDVQISAYNYGRFGSVDGRVERISADRHTDEREETFYETEVSLADPYVTESNGEKVAQHWLKPGMEVHANIRTGSRTVLEYLLKPIYESLGSSFDER